MSSRERGAPGETSSGNLFMTIWRVVARVPRGRVVTYGQVARMAGLPGGARTVGWALRALSGGVSVGGRPVPWHRVINAQGRISPRQGRPGDDECAQQARALRRDGVRVSAGGRIDLGRHLWDGRDPREARRVSG